ncbi:MAG: VOC family protein [Nocardioidaceae bacterium]|nr:VOC family protein [Nocardioidaceae bacterium]
MSENSAAPTHVYPAFQAHDPRAVIDFLVGLGFVETAAYADDAGVIQHAQVDWPEGGGVMLGIHKPDGPFTQQPGTTSVYVVAADVEAVHARAVAVGAVIDRPLDSPSYGGQEFGLRDPEGNQWGFGSYGGEPRRG